MAFWLRERLLCVSYRNLHLVHEGVSRRRTLGWSFVASWRKLVNGRQYSNASVIDARYVVDNTKSEAEAC